MSDESHINFMNQAFILAEKALQNKEVPVGCLLVYKNTNLFEGANLSNENKDATQHAEMICFEQAAKFADKMQINQSTFFQNCDLYVTVEPCIMCASAINFLNIRTVYYGCSNQRFGGCGSVENVQENFDFSIVNDGNEGTKFVKNFDNSETRAVKLLKTFYAYENDNAPEDKKRAKHTKRRLKLIDELVI